jgi:salicylate hydroxylase
MHASKRLETVDRNEDGSVTLHFADGATHKCDILVGADGIHNIVRKLIFGADDPAVSPRNNISVWLVMILKPYADVKKSVGEDIVKEDDPREFSWFGHNA